MGKCTERLYNGIVKENPTFVQMLGMCPTLAVTSSALNGAGMGLTTTCILVLSNAVISMLRKVIPDKVRIPSYIVIIASFVTVIQFLLEAYIPSLNDSLGIYIPLIVVNCIILGRAESYASKNKVLPSIFDGIGMGLGFTIGLTLIGAFRELIGKGSIFNIKILGDGNVLEGSEGALKYIGDFLSGYTPITIFVLAPGAFFVLAFLVAFINKRNASKARKAALLGDDIVETCRPEACAGCANIMCSGRIKAASTEEEVKAPETPEKTDESETVPDEKSKIIIPEKIARRPKPEATTVETTETGETAAAVEVTKTEPEAVTETDKVEATEADEATAEVETTETVAEITAVAKAETTEIGEAADTDETNEAVKPDDTDETTEADKTPDTDEEKGGSR